MTTTTAQSNAVVRPDLSAAVIGFDQLGSLLPERWHNRVETDGECWIWKGAIQPDGYGKLLGRPAHRQFYQRLRGSIPEGLQLDHLCRVLACVNPAHLEPVTDLENKRRRYASYTHCKHGHEFTPENTYIKPSGHRMCRPCNRDSVRRMRQRQSGESS